MKNPTKAQINTMITNRKAIEQFYTLKFDNWYSVAKMLQQLEIIEYNSATFDDYTTAFEELIKPDSSDTTEEEVQ